MRNVVYLNHKDIWEMIKFIKTQNRDRRYDINYDLLNSISQSEEFIIE